MTVPLILLATGALLAGMVFNHQLVGEHWQAFWGAAIHNSPANHVLHDMHALPGWVALAPSIVGVAGIALAYLLYMGLPHVPGQLATQFGGLYRFLLNKWYFDELYDRIFVKPTMSLARGLWQVGDATIIDGIPNGMAALTAQSAGRVARLQTGSIAQYAFAMLIGVVVLVSLYLIIR